MSKIVLGIDIGKKDLSLALLENKNFINKVANNTTSGFEEIVKFVSSKNREKLEIYLEATGNYSTPVADYLVTRGFNVKVVNPLKIHAFAELKLSRNKTDKADAKLIAEYGSKEDEISYKKLPEHMKKLKCLYRAYLAFKKHVTMCKNLLKNSEDQDVSDHWKNQLVNLNVQIKKIIQQMLEIIKADKNLFLAYKNLQTMPGIAEISSIAILAEIQDVSQFRSARQLACHVGVTPRHKKSGTSVNAKPKISKIGNSVLRKALYWPAVTSMNKCGSMKKFKQKQLAKGKFKKQIIIAIMKKMLYAILKKGSIFNESLLFKNA